MAVALALAPLAGYAADGPSATAPPAAASDSAAQDLQRYNELRSELKASAFPRIDSAGIALLQAAAAREMGMKAWRAETLVEEVEGHPTFESIRPGHRKSGPLVVTRFWQWFTEMCARPASDVLHGYPASAATNAAPTGAPSFVAVSDGKTRWTQNAGTTTSQGEATSVALARTLGSSVTLNDLLLNPLSEVRLAGQATVNGKMCSRVYVHVSSAGIVRARDNDNPAAPPRAGEIAHTHSWSFELGTVRTGQSYMWYLTPDGMPQRLDIEDAAGSGFRSVTLMQFEPMPSLSKSDPMFHETPPAASVP